MRKKLHWILPLTFTILVFFCVFILTFFGSQLPVFVTNILSLSIVPFLPLIPVLNKLNMVEGGIFKSPTLVGYVIGTLFYNVVLFIFGKWIASKSGR